MTNIFKIETTLSILSQFGEQPIQVYLNGWLLHKTIRSS